MKVAVVGATGMVGQVMLNVLAERNFPVTELIPVASERSVGKEIDRTPPFLSIFIAPLIKVSGSGICSSVWDNITLSKVFGLKGIFFPL